MIRYSVRIKLTDFIETPQEEQIIAIMYSIGEETNKQVFLKLWYSKDELTQDQVLLFVKRHEKMLEDIGTNIHVGGHETWATKSWFNIRKKGTPSMVEYRHEYLYDKVDGILDGLLAFRSVVRGMSTASQSLPQPQNKESGEKSNGYRVTIKRVPNV